MIFTKSSNTNSIYSFLLIVIQLNAFALSAQELPSSLNAFADELTTVEAGKYSYTQELSFDPEKPYHLMLRVNKEGKKGEEQMQYSLNLADLNTRLITWKPKGDIMEFKIQTTNRQKFIEVLKDGEADDYVNEVTIYANSSDNARAMQDLLKNCITLAKPLFSAELDINNYEEGVEWLTKNVHSVSIKRENTDQELSRIPGEAVLFLLTSQADNKQEQFNFNLADLRSPSVKMEVKGQEVSIEVKTEKSLKYIGTTKEGERNNYTNELRILVSSIEQARMMKDVLSKTIDLSKSLNAEKTPNFSTWEEGLSLAQSLVGTANAKSGEMTQALKENCNATLQKNGKESEQYNFHFADLNPKAINLKVSGKYLNIEAKTRNKESLIQYYKDGELLKYVDDLVFALDDLESAKQLAIILEKLIPLCENTRTFTFPFEGTHDEISDWLIAHVSPFETSNKDFQQVLEKMENNPCKLAFTQTESTDKKSSTEIFEFNFVDIDPRDIKYAIKGNELGVAVEATGNKKYIKHYKDDKVDDYVGSFKIYFTDLEVVRNVRAALEVLAKGCEE